MGSSRNVLGMVYFFSPHAPLHVLSLPTAHWFCPERHAAKPHWTLNCVATWNTFLLSAHGLFDIYAFNNSQHDLAVRHQRYSNICIGKYAFNNASLHDATSRTTKNPRLYTCKISLADNILLKLLEVTFGIPWGSKFRFTHEWNLTDLTQILNQTVSYNVSVRAGPIAKRNVIPYDLMNFIQSKESWWGQDRIFASFWTALAHLGKRHGK